MAWTNVANANLAVGAPVRSVDLLAIRDNISAVPNGDTGAPRIKAEALNGGQSGSAPIYAARAWVNFDGTTTTPTIRASGNVSSVTKNSTSVYTVNFTTAMPDANYTPAFSTSAFSTNTTRHIVIDGVSVTDDTPVLKTTTQLRIRRGFTGDPGGGDGPENNVIILR